MIYLDNAATTRISPKVLEEMMPYLQEQYGNPGAVYSFGRTAQDAVEKARARVARMLHCEPENIVFTSGGSESNNLVFKGLANRLLEQGKTRIITTAIEHESVLRASEALIKLGFHISRLYPDSSGIIQAKELEREFSQGVEDIGLVSVMHTNNEMGAMNDIAELSALCHGNNILFHSDCVQALGYYDVDTEHLPGLSFVSVSSHKLHGPKGVGALYVRDKSLLTPLISGGSSQEFGIRGGTENVTGIVGFGKACELLAEDRRSESVQVGMVKQRFFSTLSDCVGGSLSDAGIYINGRSPAAPGGILNLRIDGVSGETLLLMLDANDICVSAGSACTAHEDRPSHVLTAMGLSEDESRGSIRVSFSPLNTMGEAEDAARVLAYCIEDLRELQRKEE